MINTNILIRKKIPARDIQQATKIIKTKFPNAKIVCYKFSKDYRFTQNKDYLKRTMNVAFIEDYTKIKGFL